MKRTAIAVVLALAALGLLISLAIESRPLPVEVHVAQYTLAADLERVNDDFRTVAATLASSWNDMRAPGEAARALLARVEAQPTQLPATLFAMRGNGTQEARLRSSFTAFNNTIDQSTMLADGLLVDQAEYAASVDYLRDFGVRVIDDMREMGLDKTAADTFQLVVGTLDYAGPNASVQEFELRRLQSVLANDERVSAMPSEFGPLLDAVDNILTKKNNIVSRLTQLDAIPVVANATNLNLAAQDLYQSTVASVDQARLMLSVYAVVLLAAVGLVAFRLHTSYREINRANSELAQLNSSLEQRVVARTDELAGTLSDLKESQVQLVQAEKMSSLGQLVAGISHEINTPLLYLANNAELIQERLALMQDFVKCCDAAFSIKASDFSDRAEYQIEFVTALKAIKIMLRDIELDANLQEAQDLTKDSIDGLAELTTMAQSLKDFSRLDRAPVASFDVNNGLEKTLLIAKNAIKTKATVSKIYGELPEIQCSPSQINQVFLNIITNAAQAIDEYGDIIVTTRVHDDNHVSIRIADTGCGISEENMSKIRDPFFTTKEVGSGTGLGLSIVDEIIRSHGGELLVESKLGEGSAFTIILPIRRNGAGISAAEDPFADLAALTDEPTDPQRFAEAI